MNLLLYISFCLTANYNMYQHYNNNFISENSEISNCNNNFRKFAYQKSYINNYESSEISNSNKDNRKFASQKSLFDNFKLFRIDNERYAPNTKKLNRSNSSKVSFNPQVKTRNFYSFKNDDEINKITSRKILSSNEKEIFTKESQNEKYNFSNNSESIKFHKKLLN